MHQRSQQKRKERFNWYEANRIVLDYSYHDPLNGEVVFTHEFSVFVKSELNERYGFVQSILCSEDRCGEVLNRFGSLQT